MKRFLLIVTALLLCTLLRAQTDTLSIVEKTVMIDSSYLGLDIFTIVNVSQPEGVKTVVQQKLASNTIGEIQGYRIRIFFSNAQNAREASLSAQSRFENKYPEHRTYRTYVLPNFKVTVGDFRTKSDALKLLNEVKKDFPSSFIVKENINLCD